MLIPMLSIHPNRITSYFYSTDRCHGDVRPKLQGREVRQHSNGLLSNAAKKRLQNSIVALCSISHWHTVYSKADQKSYRHKLSFITLTLPSTTTMTDNEVKQRILSKFLEAWNKRSPKLLYVWKAEVTDRGTIHFHLTCNTFIHYRELRTRWNKMLYKEGLIDKDRIEPNNSTDVHAIKNIHNIAAYLTSYVAKKDLYTKVLRRWFSIYKVQIQNQAISEIKLPRNYYQHLKRKVNGTIWGCSKALLNTKLSDCFEHTNVSMELSQNKVWCGRMVVADYFSTCYIKPNEWKQSTAIRKAWNEFMTEKIRGEKNNQKMYQKF